MRKLLPITIGLAALAMSSAHAAPVITGNANAAQLATTIGGSGITISNATLTYNGTTLPELATGTFTGGTSSVGFNSGIVLTTGTIACATGANTDDSCGLDRGGSQDTTSLRFDFTSTTGNVFFRYVFGSEEYNEFVGSQFNDAFQLLLNGTNIAVLPGGGGVVSINNVNSCLNAGSYRNNSTETSGTCSTIGPNLNLDIQYDGLTAVLTASGVVGTGTNSFEFRVFDRGDNIFDSGVFIEGGSFSATDPGTGGNNGGGNQVPVPGTLALLGATMLAAGAIRRRKQ